MSTRSQIAIYEKEDAPIESVKVLLYRHSDGSPEWVLPEIKPFLNDFNKVRGIGDTAYCLARLMQHLGNLQNKYMEELYERMGTTHSANEKESKYLGYGIMTEFAGDIEYFYHVSPTAIKVYEVTSEDSKDWKLVKRVKLSAGRVIKMA